MKLVIKIALVLWGFYGSLSFSNSFTYAQEPPDSLGVDIDIFEDAEPVEITLEFNIKEFQKKKYTDEYIDASLIFKMTNPVLEKHQNVRVKARGANRRERCVLPPLWINIKKADIQNEQLKETKKIKLVTHCNNKSFEPYILKEYLAYKIYNIISPYSFRARLARVHYIDTGRKNKSTTAWAFLIEPEEMLAERLDLVPVENDRVSMDYTDINWTEYMAIFQYMIGNADYAVVGRHNVKLFSTKSANNQALIPIPYDFDYTGIVDAHYAIPGEALNLTSIKQRYFLGPCREIEDYEKVIDDIQSKKDEILSEINSFEHLSEKERMDAASYLNDFFDRVDDKDYIQENILSTCIK